MIQVVNEFKINIQSNRGNISTNILRNWSWSYLKLGWNSKSLLSQLKFNFSMFGRKACRRGTQGTSAILELQATNWLGSSCLHQYPPNRETIFLKEKIISFESYCSVLASIILTNRWCCVRCWVIFFCDEQVSVLRI